MNILIKQATIVDKNSPYNNSKKDILIKDGIITSIKDKISEKADHEISHPDLHVSIGWFDFRANFQDPGYEFKEDLHSGMEAAKKGGFTGVMLTSDTLPPVSNKSSVEYIVNKTKGNIVDVYPTGTVSHNLKGVDLSEMHDMKEAGAIAFSDSKQPVTDSGLMSRALLYAKNIDGFIMSFPLDKYLAGSAQVNESKNTTLLGLKGISNLAEELMVHRDLFLAKYHDTKIHIGPISCKESVELIKRAKKDGINVTCEVAIHNLIYTDEALNDFDSNFKLMPPLRSEDDRQALIQGLIDGTIDVISSDHTPEDTEHKDLEFDYANYGSTSLETFFGALNTLTKDLIPLDFLLTKFTVNPRSILQLDVPIVKEGFGANLTLFSISEASIIYDVSKTISKSKNSAYNGCEITGKVIGVINNQQMALN
ncbi:MAG: dihydroorotase [Bacteroidia bacterium]